MKQKKYLLLSIGISLLYFLTSWSISFAEDKPLYIPLDNIPGFGPPATFPIYLASIFSLAVWAAGISAMFMIMVGGYMYMTSAGNAASIEKAKGIITDAIIGLILALSSWLLLYTINPELVTLNPIQAINNPGKMQSVDLSGETLKTDYEYTDYSEQMDKRAVLTDLSNIQNKKEVDKAIKDYKGSDSEEDKEARKEAAKAGEGYYFSQGDSRWGSNSIGDSTSTMAAYGCAITSLAMVFNAHGISVDPGQLSKEPMFSGDLIVWPQTREGVNLVSSTSPGNIDWGEIDKQLKDGNPVIVFLRAKGNKGHFVVITGKVGDEYAVNDPAWPDSKFLESSKAAIGAYYHVSGSSVVVDKMIIYNKT